MKKRNELSYKQLKMMCNPDLFDFDTTAELAPMVSGIGQDRGIKALEFGVNVDIKGYSENSDLFQKGSTYKNSIWYDGTSTGFTITVDQITSTSATITITY